MSYDVYLKHGTLDKDLGNYTYNCSPMFHKGAGKSLSDLDNLKASKAAVYLRKGYEWMRDNPEECRKMNPSNGWGNYDSWLEYIGGILKECEANPDATLVVS